MQAAMEKELEPGRPYIFFSYLIMAMLDDRIMQPAGLPQPVEKADLTLRLIREALPTSHGGTVIGSIDYESAGEPGGAATAAAGLTVRIAATGFSFNTTTDSEGVFLVTGVPSGPVSATPSLPHLQRHTIAFTERCHCRLVVDDREAVRAALNGRIRGRVQSSRAILGTVLCLPTIQVRPIVPQPFPSSSATRPSTTT